MHGFEVCGIFFYDCFEITPLFEEELVLGRVSCVVVFDKFVKFFVEKFDLFAGRLVNFAIPLHKR